jgi:hypothetical protein
MITQLDTKVKNAVFIAIHPTTYRGGGFLAHGVLKLRCKAQYLDSGARLRYKAQHLDSEARLRCKAQHLVSELKHRSKPQHLDSE